MVPLTHPSAEFISQSTSSAVYAEITIMTD